MHTKPQKPLSSARTANRCPVAATSGYGSCTRCYDMCISGNCGAFEPETFPRQATMQRTLCGGKSIPIEGRIFPAGGDRLATDSHRHLSGGPRRTNASGGSAGELDLSDKGRDKCYNILMKNSVHFQDMLKERHIRPEWADRAVREPDTVKDHGNDGTRHFLKRIPEFGGRWIRVIVNSTEESNRRVTPFFDRRLRRQP
jgi:hypothetical protein